MSKREPHYHEFTALPAYTAPQWSNIEEDKFGDHKLLNEDDPYKWSGDAAPPAIGAKVKVYLNGLGTGIVTGYFAEYGWLGVKVAPTKPPKWWKEQNPNGKHYHCFGLDLQPRAKVTS